MHVQIYTDRAIIQDIYIYSTVFMAMDEKEAVSFVKEVLSISDVERKLSENKYELLCEIVKEFHEKIPFQNYSLIAVPSAERSQPTIDEIIREVRSGRGGLCYSLNVFMKLLLEALDYTVHHVLSAVSNLPDNHLITIASNVRDHGDKYLIEVGTGFPTFKPIPIDFDQESPVYDESFIKYKLKWVSKNRLEREMMFQVPGSEWKLFYSWETARKKLEEMDAAMTSVYTDPKITPFHTSLRAVRFVHGKAVCIRDMTLLMEDNSHILQEKKLSTELEFLDAVGEHFPLLVEAAKKALKNWTPSKEPEIGV